MYNKIDSLSIEEIDELARKPDSVVISVHLNLNVDYMLQKMWELVNDTDSQSEFMIIFIDCCRYMGLIRVYTKRRGQSPDLAEPVILASQVFRGMVVSSILSSFCLI